MKAKPDLLNLRKFATILEILNLSYLQHRYTFIIFDRNSLVLKEKLFFANLSKTVIKN